jgi:outer membrane protein OmpA-like peptidoglycan-associated protein
MRLFQYRSKVITVVLGLALLISGCATTDPYTREEKTSNAAKGAAIGAFAGAVLGVITGDTSKERRKRALIGAGLGGLAGGGIGYYMDQEEMKLRQQLEGTGVSVTRVNNDLILNMPGNITFQTGNSNLSTGFYDVLSSVALILNEFDKTTIDVVGHTDSRGSDAYNQDLSERRAASVGSFLRSQGVMSKRIYTYGSGESQPIASNDTKSGQQLNRRAELTLSPITQ